MAARRALKGTVMRLASPAGSHLMPVFSKVSPINSGKAAPATARETIAGIAKG